jgi:hypothetical protein
VEKNEQRKALVDATGFLPDARHETPQHIRKQTRRRKKVNHSTLPLQISMDIRPELQQIYKYGRWNSSLCIFVYFECKLPLDRAQIISLLALAAKYTA